MDTLLLNVGVVIPFNEMFHLNNYSLCYIAHSLCTSCVPATVHSVNVLAGSIL